MHPVNKFYFVFFQVGFVTFATYALINAGNPEERLTADKAFVAISLFNILQFPLVMLPTVFSLLIQVRGQRVGTRGD